MLDAFEMIRWTEIKVQRSNVSAAFFACDDALTAETLDADDWFLGLSKLEQARSELDVMVAMVRSVRDRRMSFDARSSEEVTIETIAAASPARATP